MKVPGYEFILQSVGLAKQELIAAVGTKRKFLLLEFDAAKARLLVLAGKIISFTGLVHSFHP